jgi:hypothetical protein
MRLPGGNFAAILIGIALDIVYDPMHGLSDKGRLCIGGYLRGGYRVSGLDRKTHGLRIPEVNRKLQELGMKEGECLMAAWGTSKGDY